MLKLDINQRSYLRSATVRYILLLILLLLGLAVWGLYYSSHFNGLYAPDAMEYASVARNLYIGRGYTNSSIWPVELLSDKTLSFPAIRRLPLHPLVMTTFFHFFGISDMAAALSSSLFFILTIPVIFLLARELFDTSVAVISTVWYIFDPGLLGFSISGLSEPLFTFLLAIALYLMVLSQSPVRLFLMGIVWGLAGLTRPNALFLFLPVVAYVYLFAKGRRGSQLIPLLGAFIIIMAPYWVRNYLTFGSPFFNTQIYSLLFNPQIYPGHSLVMTVNPPPSIYGFLATHPLVFLHKWFVNSVLIITRLPRISHPYIFAFVLVSMVITLFNRGENAKRRRFSLFLCVLILIQIFLMVISTVEDVIRYLIPFLPVMIIFAAGLLASCLKDMRSRNYFLGTIILAFLVIILQVPSLDHLHELTRKQPEKRRFTSVVELIRNNTAAGDIVASDMDAYIGWYGDRRAIWLPSVSTLHEIDSRIIPVNAILLTSGVKDIPDFDGKWKKVFEEERMVGYSLVRTIGSAKDKALLFKKDTQK